MVRGEEEEGKIDHFPGFRNHDALAPEALKPMALPTVVLLDADGQ